MPVTFCSMMVGTKASVTASERGIRSPGRRRCRSSTTGFAGAKTETSSSMPRSAPTCWRAQAAPGPDTPTAYAGSDPPACSPGTHRLVGLLTLRRLGAAGHHPIALVGAGSGLVGDPSGKTDERALLSPSELARNVTAVGAQVERIVV